MKGKKKCKNTQCRAKAVGTTTFEGSPGWLEAQVVIFGIPEITAGEPVPLCNEHAPTLTLTGENLTYREEE